MTLRFSESSSSYVLDIIQIYYDNIHFHGGCVVTACQYFIERIWGNEYILKYTAKIFERYIHNQSESTSKGLCQYPVVKTLPSNSQGVG